MGKSVRNTTTVTTDNTPAPGPALANNPSVRFREMEVEIKKGDEREKRKVQIGIATRPETLESLQEKKKLAQAHLDVADKNNTDLVEALNKAIAAIDARIAQLSAATDASK